MRANANGRRRAVSFDVAAAPVAIAPTNAAPIPNNITSSATSVSVRGQRMAEYCVFLVSVSAVTLSITLFQPLVLFHCLVQCKEPRCFNVAIAVHQSIAPSMAPCQDFFNYSCGDGRATRFFARLEQSLRTAALRWVSAVPVPRSGQSAVQKAAMLLRGCLKLTMQKNEDVDAIRNVLSAGGLAFPKMPTTSKYSTVRSIVEFNLNAGIAPVFRLTAGRSLYSGSGYMLHVTPNYDIVSFAEYLQQLGPSENFDVYVRRCAEVIGERGMSYAALIRAVKSVNQAFAELSVTKPLHVELKLSPQYPQAGFWQSLCTILHKKLQFLDVAKRKFLILDEGYFNFLAYRVFDPLEAKEIAAYIGLYVVWYLSRVASYTLAYSSPVPNYTHGLKDMWLRCYADVHTLMPFAVEHLYLHAAIIKKDVEEMESIVQAVTQATKDFVSALPREGRPSEARLIDKIGKLRVFPYSFASLHEPHQLNRLYAHVPDQRDVDFVYNFLRLSRMTAEYMVRLLLNSSADVTEPFVPPFEAGVPYMASVFNMVHLSPAVVLPPAFTSGQSLSLNYAGLGYNVAEQVGQLFLRSPSILNETGGYERVWSDRFFNSLRRKYQCLRNMFREGEWNATEIPRDVLRASVTAEIAFKAFMEVRRSPAHAARFRQERDHFGMAPEQLFFVGICMNWRQRRHEPRGLAELVCRFSMRSLQGFNEVFSCPKTTALAALEKCPI
ncbi:phosphate-regulating neutral endopeptidase PHEX-like isoform X2 [Dermacentor albipictus]